MFLEALILEKQYFTGWNSSRYDSRKKQNLVFQRNLWIHNGGPKMRKKVVGRHLLHIWTSTNPRNLTNQDSQLLDSSRPYGRLLENQKPGGSRKLFLAWKWFPRYLKILSLANSLIANNNIRSIILEIKNNRCKIINTNISFSLPRTL